MAQWVLVVPQGGDQVPRLLNLMEPGVGESLAAEQEIRSHIGEPAALLYAVSPHNVVPVKLQARTQYQLAPLDAAEETQIFTAPQSYLPAPDPLPQRRPRREDLLEGKGDPLVVSGDDTPPEYDPESGERLQPAGSLAVFGLDKDAEPEAMPRRVGPFQRRRD